MWTAPYRYFIGNLFVLQYSQKSKEVPVSVSEKQKKTDAEVVERYKVLKDNNAEIPSAPLISPGTKFADYHIKFASQLEGFKDLLVSINSLH